MRLLKGQVGNFLLMMIKFFLMIAICVAVYLLVSNFISSYNLV